MDNQSFENRIAKMESDLFRLGTEPEKFEFDGIHSGSAPVDPPAVDLLILARRVHAIPDLMRGAHALVDSRGGDYCKGLANGLICAWNMLMDSDCKYVDVDSEVGHHDAVIFYQDIQEKLSSVTIPAPLTQTEGEQRMYEFDL